MSMGKVGIFSGYGGGREGEGKGGVRVGNKAAHTHVVVIFVT